MKRIEGVGILVGIVAGCLWFLSRWIHEVQRCFRSSEALEEFGRCDQLIELPSPVVHLWLVLVLLSVAWSLVLFLRKRTAMVNATFAVAFSVFFLAASLI